jgi:hypothetical protein
VFILYFKFWPLETFVSERFSLFKHYFLLISVVLKISVYFIKFSHIPGFSLSIYHLGFIIFYFLLEGRLSSMVRVKSSNPRVTRVSGLVDDSPDITSKSAFILRQPRLRQVM